MRATAIPPTPWRTSAPTATVLVLALALGASVGAAPEDASGVAEAHVQEALEAAGENRPALEEVLAHYAAAGDARKVEGARFLIANMVGHGYVITELQDADGGVIEYDPLAYDTFAESREALEALEAEHGELDFKRQRLLKDVETIQADYLIRHIDAAFAAWEAAPPECRVTYRAFLDHVLPYRGSQEPLDFWIGPLRERYGSLWEEEAGDVKAVRKRLSRDVHARVRFNERYYLHPTDQGFKEMVVSGQGRCEDITNMMTYASRSLAIATAADYTPAWAHRDNNHAWNVLLDRDGRGHDPANAHAAKVYRKTFALQRDNLAFLLADGEEAPNRFLASKTYVDVTDQYGPTTDVAVDLDPAAAEGHRFAYACVFNGGEWVAIHWGRVAEGRVVFDRLGRNVAYLPAVHGDAGLKAAAEPFLLHRNGTVRRLPGRGGATGAVLTAVRPRQKSPDTHEETPVSHLEPGTTYRLQRWTPEGWRTVRELEAAGEAPRFEDLPSDTLFWMVAEGSRRLERIFTIQEGRQRFW